MVNRDDWARLFLDRCGWPHTKANLTALVCWQAAEGGPNAPGGRQAHYNPLNTTLKAPGSWEFNWVGVQNYPTLYVGLDATRKTLLDTKDAGYAPIRRALREGKSAEAVLKAVESSMWGTGGLALRILPYVKADAERQGNVYWNVPIGQ